MSFSYQSVGGSLCVAALMVLPFLLGRLKDRFMAMSVRRGWRLSRFM